MTAPTIPRRTHAVLKTGLRSIYISGWRRGIWQGAILGALLMVLIVEAARRFA